MGERLPSPAIFQVSPSKCRPGHLHVLKSAVRPTWRYTAFLIVTDLTVTGIGLPCLLYGPPCSSLRLFFSRRLPPLSFLFSMLLGSRFSVSPFLLLSLSLFFHRTIQTSQWSCCLSFYDLFYSDSGLAAASNSTVSRLTLS